MLKNIVKIGLGIGLVASISNAQTFKKGDNVIVKKGFPICYHTKNDGDNALRNVRNGVDAFLFFTYDMDDREKGNKNFTPILDGKNTSPRVCIIYNYDTKAVYFADGVHDDGVHYIYDKDDYGAVPRNALKKDISKPKSSQPNYSFVGIDDLEAFPSDYIGKLSFLKCKRSTPEEMKGGGYTIMSNCAKSDGSYGFGSNNPFKIQIQTSSKDMARAIAKSKRQEKWFLGTVKKNPEKYSVAKNIFIINEVHYK